MKTGQTHQHVQESWGTYVCLLPLMEHMYYLHSPRASVYSLCTGHKKVLASLVLVGGLCRWAVSGCKTFRGKKLQFLDFAHTDPSFIDAHTWTLGGALPRILSLTQLMFCCFFGAEVLECQSWLCSCQQCKLRALLTQSFLCALQSF